MHRFFCKFHCFKNFHAAVHGKLFTHFLRLCEKFSQHQKICENLHAVLIGLPQMKKTTKNKCIGAEDFTQISFFTWDCFLTLNWIVLFAVIMPNRNLEKYQSYFFDWACVFNQEVEANVSHIFVFFWCFHKRSFEFKAKIFGNFLGSNDSLKS